MYSCGLLEPDEGSPPVGASAASALTLYTPEEVKEIITDPSHTLKSDIFSDSHWITETDQTNEEACAGWSCATATAKTGYLSGIKDQPTLSGSYVYAGCNGGNLQGGAQLKDCAAWIQSHGAPPASLCGPHLIARRQTTQFDAIAGNDLGLGFIHIATEQELDSAIAANLIVVVCVQVTQPFKAFRGKGILPAYSGRGNHSVHVDDIIYQNGQKLYRLVNNWNLGWGWRGTALVTFASFAQTIGIHYFYAATSTQVKAAA